MAELVNLNNLTIKTDSLLDNWKMVLLDPETGLPAKNITVATFVELFTQKQPVATNNNSGLLSFSLSEYNILTDPYRIVIYSIPHLQRITRQTIRNQRRNTYGQLTRLVKLSWNYKTKTNNLNKSSLTMASRYKSNNLSRAGSPRLGYNSAGRTKII